MDYGDFVSFEVDLEISLEKKGFITYIKDEDEYRYVEVMYENIVNEKTYTITNSWIGIFFSNEDVGFTNVENSKMNGLNGTSLDDNKIKKFTIINDNTQSKSFWNFPYKLNEDIIVVGITNGRNNYTGKRYIIETIDEEQNKLILAEYDTEIPEILNIDITNGMCISDKFFIATFIPFDLTLSSDSGGLLELINDKEEEEEEEIIQVVQETLLQTEERELTDEQKSQWISLNFKKHFLNKRKEKRSKYETNDESVVNRQIKRFFEIIEEQDEYIKKSFDLWRERLFIDTKNILLPLTTNVVSKTTDNVSISDELENYELYSKILEYMIHEYDKYLKYGFVESTFDVYCKYQQSIVKNGFEYEEVNYNLKSKNSVLTYDENNNQLMILGPFKGPVFYTNKYGNIISKKVEYIKSDKYNINGVINTLNDEKYTIEYLYEVMNNPVKFFELYKRLNIELSKFLKIFNIRFVDLPYGHARMFLGLKEVIPKNENVSENLTMKEYSQKRINYKYIKLSDEVKINKGKGISQESLINIYEKKTELLYTQAKKRIYGTKTSEYCGKEYVEILQLQLHSILRPFIWNFNDDSANNFKNKLYVDDKIKKGERLNLWIKQCAYKELLDNGFSEEEIITFINILECDPEKKLFMIGDYVKNNEKIYQLRYDFKEHKKVWTLVKINASSFVDSKENKDLDFASMKINSQIELQRLINEFEFYLNTIHEKDEDEKMNLLLNKINREKDKNTIRIKDTVKKNQNIKIEEKQESIPSLDKWNFLESLKFNTKVSKNTIAKEQLKIITEGEFLREPTFVENINYYYDIETGKISISKHYMLKLKIVLDVKNAQIHWKDLLFRWGVMDENKNWVSKVDGDFLRKADDLVDTAFDDNGNVKAHYGFIETEKEKIDDKLDNIENDPSRESSMMLLDDIKNTFDLIFKLFHIEEQEDISFLIQRVFSKIVGSNELELYVEVETWAPMVKENPKLLFKLVTEYLKIPTEKLTKYKKKWAIEVFRAEQLVFVASSVQKQLYTSVGLLISSLFFIEKYQSKNVELYLKTLVKFGNTSNLNSLKYLSKKLVSKSNNNTNIESTELKSNDTSKEDFLSYVSEKWQTNLNEKKNKQKTLYDTTYIWNGFLPNKKITITEVNQIDENNSTIFMTIKKTIPSRQQEELNFKKSKKDVKLIKKNKKEGNENESYSWIQDLHAKVLWLNKKSDNLDKLQTVEGEYQWTIQTDNIHLFREVLLQTYILFSTNTIPKISQLQIPSSWKLLPGIKKKLQEWNTVDSFSIDFYKEIKNAFKGENDKKVQEQLDYVKHIVEKEMNSLIYFIRNPIVFQGSEVFYLNIWVNFCKHMFEDDIYIDKNIIKYSEFIQVIKKGFKFMLNNINKISSPVGVLSDSELDHYQAINLEIERERYLKTGAEMNNEERNVDQTLKKLKLGRWKKGLDSIWKTVDDYEETRFNDEEPDQTNEEDLFDEDVGVTEEGEELFFSSEGDDVAEND
jgi:hypothetical protein